MMYDIIPIIAKDGEIVKKKIDQPLTALARKSAEANLPVFRLLSSKSRTLTPRRCALTNASAIDAGIKE
jgi:hypothetical protein